jgi:hypothetical protein
LFVLSANAGLSQIKMTRGPLWHSRRHADE